MIVFGDVDIEAVVDWVMVGIFMCTGQVCSATSRLLVHSSVEKELMAALIASTYIGPLVKTAPHNRDLRCGLHPSTLG